MFSDLAEATMPSIVKWHFAWRAPLVNRGTKRSWRAWLGPGSGPGSNRAMARSSRDILASSPLASPAFPTARSNPLTGSTPPNMHMPDILGVGTPAPRRLLRVVALHTPKTWKTWKTCLEPHRRGPAWILQIADDPYRATQARLGLERHLTNITRPTLTTEPKSDHGNRGRWSRPLAVTPSIARSAKRHRRVRHSHFTKERYGSKGRH